MGLVENFYLYVKRIVVNFRVKTCCCIVPLRPGIIILAYLNVFVAVLLIVGTATSSVKTISAQVQFVIAEDTSVATCILAPVADLAASILLLCAIHRKDLVLLRVYCWYGVAAIIASCLAYSLTIPLLDAISILFIIISLLYQIYVLVLVRSVMVDIKLENAAPKNIFVYNKREDKLLVKDIEDVAEIKSETQVDDKKAELEIIDETHPAEEPKESLSKTNTLKVDAQTNTISTVESPPSWKSTYIYRPILTTKVDATVTSSSASSSKDNKTVGDRDVTTTTGTKNVDSKTAASAKEASTVNVTEVKADTSKVEDKTVGDKTEKVANESDVKKEVPVKKKRGIFKRTPKEEKKNKKGDSS